MHPNIINGKRGINTIYRQIDKHELIDGKISNNEWNSNNRTSHLKCYRMAYRSCLISNRNIGKRIGNGNATGNINEQGGLRINFNLLTGPATSGRSNARG